MRWREQAGVLAVTTTVAAAGEPRIVLGVLNQYRFPGDPFQVTSDRSPRVSRAARPGTDGAASSRRAGEREQVLVSMWLAGLRSERTRRAYAGDVAALPADQDTDVLAAGRAQVDLWAAPSSTT